MKGKLKNLLLLNSVLALGAGVTGAAFAAIADNDHDGYAVALEEVRSFSTLGGLHDFDVIDRDTLIIWTRPSKPYLVELAFPSFDLPFSHAIGIRSYLSRVYAGLDSIVVDGFSYKIDRIYQLDRDEARALKEQTAAR